ncbi:unnamed protein product [Schistocephalus solidus]|uniref:TBD domain-containing protein n=1 Tax=Schistocephalus solidus TaxID=70667 RepID=A0A183TK32_SCHSO|nr:unnamed protein product [Schistocephalus solidus]
MTDASVEYVKKLEKQKSEHETKMADLERENANRIGEMTEKFNRLKADLSTQVPQEFGGLENSILQHLPPDESSEQTALHHSFRSAHSAAHSAVKRTVTLPPQSSIERIQSAPARSRTPFAVGFCSPQPPRANRPEVS